MKAFVVEACVEDLESALAAEKNGADQIELCAHLDKDGLTPDFTLIKEVNSSVNIPVKVMIRPRDGNFSYNDDEVEHMIDAISKCRYVGVDSVVIGAMTKGRKKIDIELVEELSAVAYPLNVTVHKAIDHCVDPIREINRLRKIKNINAILTSGRGETAIEGKEVIQSMIEESGDRFTIIAAGKITKENLSEVHKEIGAKSYHGRAIV